MRNYDARSSKFEKRVMEWFELILRWSHVFAGIMWVGATYYFTWLDVLKHNDGFTFVPVLLFTAGTQRFGFNTSYHSSSNIIRNNFLPSNQQVSEQTGFGAQSVSLVLRSDYSIGKFFIMPQVLMDYYLPQSDDRFNMAYSIVTGFNF